MENNKTPYTRRGLPVYSENPTIKDVKLQANQRALEIRKENKVLIVDAKDGDVIGEGSTVFMQRNIIDPERFMKVYIGTLDQMFDLTKGSQSVFKLLWQQVQNNPDTDKVEISYLLAKSMGLDISERLFQRAVKELLEKEFIFMSLSPSVYFINMKRFFMVIEFMS